MQRPWSCDTFVVQRDAARNGRLIFGKNSDRPAGEAQPLRFARARGRGAGPLKLSHLSIDDADAYAHLGSAPFWCWGYEFGINEHGVAIGNEAQFTRSLAQNVAAARAGDEPASGIIGMELLRLGLERGASASQALQVMTALLEAHGQWGSGLFGRPAVDGAYDNSFIIADRSDAWVLETSGREWVSRQVTRGTYSISNEPSIRSVYDGASRGLLATARSAGWWNPEENFDYAATHVDELVPLQVSHLRQRRSGQLLVEAQQTGGVSVPAAKAVLRDHFEGTFLNGPYFNAARPDFLTLCMHEHPAGFTWGNTAASVIIEQASDDEGLTVIWWTPMPPCVGVYIPLFLESGGLPPSLASPGQEDGVFRPERYVQAKFDPTSYWWRMQNLLDAVKGDMLGSRYAERQPLVRARFDVLEAAWSQESDKLRARWRETDAEDRPRLADELSALTARAVKAVDLEVERFIRQFEPAGLGRPIDQRWSS